MSACFAKTGVTASQRELLELFCEDSFRSLKGSFKTLVLDLVPMTDASDYGWSGVIPPFVIGVTWSGLDQFRSINERECLETTFFMFFMKSCLVGEHVVIHKNSEVVFLSLRKMGFLRFP